MVNKAWILLSLLAAYVCDASEILVVFPLPGKSHAILGHALVVHLLNAGHEVSYITPYPMNTSNPKLHNIDISSHLELLKASGGEVTIKSITNKEWKGLDQTSFFFMFHKISVMTFEHVNVQKMLRDPHQHFDLVISEWMFDELYCGFSGIYNAPMIWLSAYEANWMILNLIDGYTNPAFNGYYVDDTPPFNFFQRITELWFTLKMAAVRETIALYQQTSAYNKLIAPFIESRGRMAPSFSELRYEAALVLGNSHVSMGQATTLPQSFKPVGGYHIGNTHEALPENLKRVMDNSKHGVIYFSMGSNLASKDMPDELKKSLLDVFSSLKQTVLWKFEENLQNLPENVHIFEWASQHSILTHPNCVLFITHGGQLSTTEAIYAGKPIIGIPCFADQFTNIARAVNKGIARKVELSYAMGPQLKTTIEEVLSNPRYAQKAKELSYIFHDRPVTPGAELIHWVEHVIKTKGAPHLRSPALLLPWYQKLYIDLIVIVLIIIITLRTSMQQLMSVY